MKTKIAILPLALALAGCPSSVVNPSGGSGGTGGSGGSGGSGGDVGGSGGTAGSGGSGPCFSAEDCAGLTDICNTGTCINGACEKVPANDGAVCDDGKQCTVNDTCQAGVCTSGNLKFCSSSDSCHVGFCNPQTDQCEQQAGNDGAACDDGDACTYDGVCQNGSCAQGPQIDCSFLDDQCHTGECQQGLGCVQVDGNEGLACDDGLFCTMNDVCTAGSCGGVPTQCAPLTGCFVSTCDEAADSCVAVPGNDGAQCDDFNACTTGTTCLAGACIGGSPTNEGMACDDGTSCTTGEFCTQGVCGGGNGPTVYFADDFKDNSKGWTLGLTWEIGPATGSSGGACGADPDSDHSPSADDGIAGVVIGGNAPTNIHDMYYLESPPFDTSGAQGQVIFQFWRWLTSDYDPYMHNNVEVWDGVQWIVLETLDSPPCFADMGWTFVSYDVTALKNAGMRVRFGYDIQSGGVYTIGSWNVDDVMIASAACM